MWQLFEEWLADLDRRVIMRVLSHSVDQTLTELRALKDCDLARAEDERTRKILRAYIEDPNKRPATPEEANHLELILLQVLPENALWLRYETLKLRYEKLGMSCPTSVEVKLSDSDKDKKEKANGDTVLAPVEQTKRIATLRDVAAFMTSDIQWNNKKTVILQRTAQKIRIGVLWRSVAIAMVLWSLAVYCFHAPRVIVFAMEMGLLGSFVSILRRMMNDDLDFSSRNVPYRAFTILEIGAGSVYAALVTGPIFGLVAFLLIHGQLAGGMVPVVKDCYCWAFGQCGPDPDCTFKAFASLMVFCFAAGFAEKFIPDVLDKMIGKSKNKKTQG